MKYFFEKFSGREQGLFLILIWSGVFYWAISSLGRTIERYQAYDLHANAVRSHNKIIETRPATKKKISDRLKSHDTRISRKILENGAYGDAKNIHANVWMPKQSKERPMGEFFQQHTVQIQFKAANWGHLEQYVDRIKSRKHMFISEVRIKPTYLPSDQDTVQNYSGLFSVSALELKKRF